MANALLVENGDRVVRGFAVNFDSIFQQMQGQAVQGLGAAEPDSLSDRFGPRRTMCFLDFT